MTSSSPAAATTACTFRDYFTGLFEHDRAANGHVLTTMTALGDHLPQKPLDRMSHLIVCQRLWLSRMTNDVTHPGSIFPTWTLEEAKDQAEMTFGRMRRFIAELAEAGFHEPFVYTRMEGDRYRTRRRDVLTQLAEHGAYHRGQIAVELNPLLDVPLTTDYIFHVTEKVDR